MSQHLLAHQTLGHAGSGYGSQLEPLSSILLCILDQQFVATSGNRTDRILKNVLLSTFAGMFVEIPNLAISKAQKFISDPPTKENLATVNSKIFSFMDRDCQELGCTFTSDMKTNISGLEERYDEKFEEKVNIVTLTATVRSVFLNTWELIYGNGTLVFDLNVTMDTTKEEIAAEVDRVVALVDADCAADTCTFTPDLKTSVTDMLEANWTTLHEGKTAAAVAGVLSATFADFGEQ